MKTTYTYTYAVTLTLRGGSTLQGGQEIVSQMQDIAESGKLGSLVKVYGEDDKHYTLVPFTSIDTASVVITREEEEVEDDFCK